jgi:hypothetical protein
MQTGSKLSLNAIAARCVGAASVAATVAFLISTRLFPHAGLDVSLSAALGAAVVTAWYWSKELRARK